MTNDFLKKSKIKGTSGPGRRPACTQWRLARSWMDRPWCCPRSLAASVGLTSLTFSMLSVCLSPASAFLPRVSMVRIVDAGYRLGECESALLAVQRVALGANVISVESQECLAFCRHSIQGCL